MIRIAAPLEQVVADLRDAEYVQDTEQMVAPLAEDLIGTRLSSALAPETRALARLVYLLSQKDVQSGALPASVTLGDEAVGLCHASYISLPSGNLALTFVPRYRRLLLMMWEIAKEYWKNRISAGYDAAFRTISVILQQQEILLRAPRARMPEEGLVSNAIQRLMTAYLRLKCAVLAKVMAFHRNATSSPPLQQSPNYFNLAMLAYHRATAMWEKWSGPTALKVLLAAYTAHALFTIGTVDPAKRILGIVPISKMRQTQDVVASHKIFRITGFLFAIQAVALAGKLMIDSVRSLQREADATPVTAPVMSNRSASNAPTCALCLQSRINPTSTVCGHIGCWECMLRACFEKPECPICRQACLPQQLLKLHNIT